MHDNVITKVLIVYVLDDKVQLTHIKDVKILTSIPCNLCAVKLVYARIIKSAIILSSQPLRMGL